MIGLDVRTVKQNILDRKRIADAAERASVRALTKFGAFVRQRSKHSIRKRKGISAPGSPPSSHTGLLRDRILFDVERGTGNVVIGPMLLHGTRSETALKALEHGGPSLIVERGKPKTVMISARPFMRPAFDIETKKAPKLWENSLR